MCPQNHEAPVRHGQGVRRPGGLGPRPLLSLRAGTPRAALTARQTPTVSRGHTQGVRFAQTEAAASAARLYRVTLP